MAGRNVPKKEDEDAVRNDDDDIETLKDPSEDPSVP
jgi:hypothetical protein